MALEGGLAVDRKLAKLHPQLTADDLLKIKDLRSKKEYSDWNEVFMDLLESKGIKIPPE